MTYARPDTLIPPQKIEVTVTKPGLTARARTRTGAGGCRSDPARLALAVLFAAAGATVLAAQGQRIRSGVELVSLNVTATDGQGKYATDLNEEEFEVYEDGAKQKLTFFSKTQQPISLALLLDTSASMDERMGIAQEAAIGFAKQLHKEDQAEVIDFDSQVRVLADVHQRRRRARKGDPHDDAQRLDLALQRALHRAEGAEEGRRRRRRPTSAGRRSCCSPTATTRRA